MNVLMSSNRRPFTMDFPTSEEPTMADPELRLESNTTVERFLQIRW